MRLHLETRDRLFCMSEAKQRHWHWFVCFFVCELCLRQAVIRQAKLTGQMKTTHYFLNAHKKIAFGVHIFTFHSANCFSVARKKHLRSQQNSLFGRNMSKQTTFWFNFKRKQAPNKKNILMEMKRLNLWSIESFECVRTNEMAMETSSRDSVITQRITNHIWIYEIFHYQTSWFARRIQWRFTFFNHFDAKRQTNKSSDLFTTLQHINFCISIRNLF